MNFIAMIYNRLFFLVLIVAVVSCTSPDYIGKIELESDTNYLPYTPVQFPFFDDKVDGNDIYIQKPNQHFDEAIPLQIDNSRANFILPKTWDGTSEEYYLSVSDEKKIYSNLQIQDDDSTLTLLSNNKPVLRYVYMKTNVPSREDSIYARSGFIHPLWAPNGSILTNIHPDDHLHHLGLWHPWTKVTFQNREIDFWNLGKGLGTVYHTKFLSRETGPVFSSFVAEHTYFDISKNGSNKPVLNEFIKIKLWDITPEQGYLIDYTITQNCASQDSVKLEQYRYGGFGFRATHDWTGSNRNYLTSEGKNIKDADASNARWCMIWGDTGQGESTILFMSHPDNYEHPEPLRIWGEWTDDTFFNFCPIREKSLTIIPGEAYVQKFRIYIVSDTIQPESAEAKWEVFAYPPEVLVVWDN